LTVYIRKWLTILGDTFWLLPGVLVVFGIVLALVMVGLDRSGAVPQWLIDSPWLYNGGGTGVERDPGRLAELQRHADLLAGDAERSLTTPDDLEVVRTRHAGFAAVRLKGSLALLAVARRP